jgi:hypothetical protein
MGCFLCSSKDLLSKNVNYSHIIIKAMKMTLVRKTDETKKFAEIFYKASRTYFHFLKRIF